MKDIQNSRIIVPSPPLGSDNKKLWNALSIALCFFGLLGLGASYIGIAQLGAHLNSLAAGGLTNIRQVEAISMLFIGRAVGGALLIASLVARVKAANQKKEDPSLERPAIAHKAVEEKVILNKLRTVLKPRTGAFVQQANGKYTLYLMHNPFYGQEKGAIDKWKSDISSHEIQYLINEANKLDYQIQTAVISLE